jgi:hypothetical protein
LGGSQIKQAVHERALGRTQACSWFLIPALRAKRRGCLLIADSYHRLRWQGPSHFRTCWSSKDATIRRAWVRGVVGA